MKNINKDLLRYWSPEQIHGSVYYVSDIWGFGCTILEICTGLKPYNDITSKFDICVQLLHMKINPLEYALLKHEGECMIIIDNPELMDLLEECFTYDRNERPNA